MSKINSMLQKNQRTLTALFLISTAVLFFESSNIHGLKFVLNGILVLYGLACLFWWSIMKKTSALRGLVVDRSSA